MRANKTFILALFFVFLAYLPALSGGFVFDDGHMIVNNVLIRGLKYIPYFFKGIVDSHNMKQDVMFRPLLMLTFMLNYFISRLSPWSYHLFNVLLHLANIYLLFILFCLTFPKADRRLLAAFAFLFGIHPVNTEAVAYVSSRSDLLVSFFLLFALIKYIQKKYRLSFLFFILAFLSKETAVIFLPLIFVYDLCLRTKTPSKRRYKFYLIVFLGTLFFVILRQFLYGSATTPSHLRSFLDNIATQSYVSWFYLELFLFPFKLCADWPIYTIKFLSLKGLSSIALIILVLALSFLGRKRYPYLALGVFFYFLSLSPKFIAILNFPACEHHLYFPSLGLYIILAYFLSKFPYRRTKYLFWFVIPTFALLTFFRGFDYKNNYTFWRSVLRVNKKSCRAKTFVFMYANHYQDIEEAERLFSVCSNNNYVKEIPYLLLADVYVKAGLYKQALAVVNKGLKYFPSLPLLIKGADVFIAEEEYDKAEKVLLFAINKFNAGRREVFKAKAELGYVYLMKNNFQKAIYYLKSALSDNPFYYTAYTYISLAYNKIGGKKAKAYLEKDR